MNRFAIIAGIYLLGSALTFGHQGARYTRECDRLATTSAWLASAIWPLYWPYRLSWDAFNAPPKHSQCPAP